MGCTNDTDDTVDTRSKTMSLISAHARRLDSQRFGPDGAREEKPRVKAFASISLIGSLAPQYGL